MYFCSFTAFFMLECDFMFAPRLCNLIQVVKLVIPILLWNGRHAFACPVSAVWLMWWLFRRAMWGTMISPIS